MKTKNFCPFCGFKFKYKNAIQCPNCKKDLNTYIAFPKFCENCGGLCDYSTTLSPKICDKCGVKKNNDSDFNLKQFLTDNSSLFVIFGVFIALSVYLTQFISSFKNNLIPLKIFNTPVNYIEISIGSSLLIAFIILLLILNELNKGNLFERYFNFLSDYMPNFPLGMLIRYLFIIPFLILISGILIFLYTTYQIVITLFLLAIAVILAITLFVFGSAIITNIVFPKKSESNVRKPISLYILLYSLAIVLVAQLCLNFLIPIIQNNTNNSTISLSMATFFYALFFSGILGIIVTIVFIAISIKIQKAERMGVDLGRRGIELSNSEKYDEALECYNRALEIDPYNAKTWYNRGVLMGKIKKYEEGIKNFEKAMEINPTYELAKKARDNFLEEIK